MTMAEQDVSPFGPSQTEAPMAAGIQSALDIIAGYKNSGSDDADNSGGRVGSSGNGIDFEELRRREMLRGTRVDSSAAVVSPDGPDGGGKVDVKSGERALPSKARYRHSTARATTTAMAITTTTSNPTSDARSGGTSNEKGKKSNPNKAVIPLDTTDADFGRLKTRTLLTAFERMKRDERVAEIPFGSSRERTSGSSSDAAAAAVPVSPDSMDGSAAALSTPKSGRADGKSYSKVPRDAAERAASYHQQDRHRHSPGAVSILSEFTPRQNNLVPVKEDGGATVDNDAGGKSGTGRDGDGGTDHNMLDASIIDASPDSSGDFTSADHAYLRAGKSVRPTNHVGAGSGRESADAAAGLGMEAAASATPSDHMTSGRRLETRVESTTRTEHHYDGHTGANVTASEMVKKKSTGTEAVTARLTLKRDRLHSGAGSTGTGRAAKAEKEPSPSPSGRYGAISPPGSPSGVSTLGSRSAQSKPMSRMVSKYAAAAALSMGLDSTEVPAIPVVGEEQQSVVSTLASVNTTVSVEDTSSGLDHDHYFLQDQGLNPPSPAKAFRRSTARAERSAFAQNKTPVESATSAEVRALTGPTGGMIHKTDSNREEASEDAFLDRIKSDAYVLTGAWSANDHPSSKQDAPSTPVGNRAVGKGANNHTAPAPYQSSPLREFMAIRRQMADINGETKGNVDKMAAVPNEASAPDSRSKSARHDVVTDFGSPPPLAFSAPTDKDATSAGRTLISIADDVLEEGPQPEVAVSRKHFASNLSTIEEIDRELDRRENERKRRQRTVASVHHTRISNVMRPQSPAMINRLSQSHNSQERGADGGPLAFYASLSADPITREAISISTSSRNDSALAEMSVHFRQPRARVPKNTRRGTKTSDARELSSSERWGRDMRKKTNRVKAAAEAASRDEGTVSDSSSSESSASQIAECVSDVSPPPPSRRELRKRKEELQVRRKERRSKEIKEDDDTTFDSVETPRKVFPNGKDMLNFMSASSIPFTTFEDESLATEDDNGLLKFISTSSVPSVPSYGIDGAEEPSAFSSALDDEASTRVSSTVGDRTALNSLPEGSRNNSDDIAGDSSTSSTEATESESLSDASPNQRAGRQIKPRHKQGKSSSGYKKEKLNKGDVYTEDRDTGKRPQHKREGSGVTKTSSFFSTPSDEHREYKVDEVFSGAYRADEDWPTTNKSGKVEAATPSPLQTRSDATGSVDLEALNLEAAEHVERGEYDVALRAFSKVLDAHAARYGERHPFVASTYHNMGIVHAKNSKTQLSSAAAAKSNADALHCFQNAARIARDSLGSDHPNVAVSLVRLGFILLAMEEHENALVTFQEALRVRVASLGGDHALVSKIYNNIGVTNLHVKRFDKARDAFEAALGIQRKVLSRVSGDCDNGRVGKEFVQRARLEVADTLCNIGSLNLNWTEVSTCPADKKDELMNEATDVFTEALEIRLVELGFMHPVTKRTKSLLEKTQRGEDNADAKPALKPKPKPARRPAKTKANADSVKRHALLKPISEDDGTNSIADSSVITQQVGCSPGDILGFGALCQYATDYMPSSKTLKEIDNANSPDCCVQLEDRTCVWVSPHCIPDIIPSRNGDSDPLFSRDSPFKDLLGWPVEREKTVEDLFNGEGITVPGVDSDAESSITMEKVSSKFVELKRSDNNDDEESVMIAEFVPPTRGGGNTNELPVPDIDIPVDSATKGGKKKASKKRRGFMLMSTMRRPKSSNLGATKNAPSATNDTGQASKLTSILKGSRKMSNAEDHIRQIEDIDGGDNDYAIPGENSELVHRKQPSPKDVKRMMKNPESNANLRGLYAAASAYVERNEYDKAEALLESLVASHRTEHGNVHSRVGTALHNLGIVYLKAGRHEEALATFAEAVGVRMKVAASSEKDDPDVAATLVKMGITNLLLRRFEGALESFREALSVRRRTLGELHPSTARVYNNIGCVHVEFNQFHEARGAFEAALQVQRHALWSDPRNGPLRFGTSTTLCNLGYLYKNQGLHHKSAAALREALEMQETVLGKHHPTVLGTLDTLAEASARNNNCPEAIRCYNSILIRINSTGKEGEMTREQRRASAIALYKISRVHLKQKDFDAAVRKLKEATFYARGLGDAELASRFETEMENIKRAQRNEQMR